MQIAHEPGKLKHPPGAPSEQFGPTTSNASRTSAIEVCDSTDGLSAIKIPSKELIICKRPLAKNLARWLVDLAPSCLPDFRILVRLEDFRQALKMELDDCGMPAGGLCDLFIEDMFSLAKVFTDVTGQCLVDVRLERINHDACWKFHRDSVDIRLLTTYRGPATEWVQPTDSEQALTDQRNYDGPLNSLAPNDVAIFKGSRSGTATGIVHRSPPISGTDWIRLLFCLNAPSGTSPILWHSDD